MTLLEHEIERDRLEKEYGDLLKSIRGLEDLLKALKPYEKYSDDISLAMYDIYGQIDSVLCYANDAEKSIGKDLDRARMACEYAPAWGVPFDKEEAMGF